MEEGRCNIGTTSVQWYMFCLDLLAFTPSGLRSEVLPSSADPDTRRPRPRLSVKTHQELFRGRSFSLQVGPTRPYSRSRCRRVFTMRGIAFGYDTFHRQYGLSRCGLRFADFVEFFCEARCTSNNHFACGVTSHGMRGYCAELNCIAASSKVDQDRRRGRCGVDGED